MLTIKVYLAESGAVADLQKDFPLFRGQYQNVLLNAFVPVSLLAPNFMVYKADNEMISPFVSGTAIKCAMRTIERDGTYKLSETYYLRFVKTLLKDGVSYALFERALPKEFCTYAGQGINAPALIFNVENIDYGTITSATAETTGETVVSVDLATVQAKLPALDYDYVFIYDESTETWYIDGEPILLSNYGISLTGTPADQEEITLSVVASDPTTISVLTTQEVRLDVMQSVNIPPEELDPDTYAELIAQINGIIQDLLLKQNKSDNTLQTRSKTVVGAINEIFHQAVLSEDYIGTMNYSASSVGDLPSDAMLLAYAKSQRGADYSLQRNDVIVVVQILTGAADVTWKYIWNDSEWVYYKISSSQMAQNGVEGIIEGTFNVGANYDVLVDITNGQIVNIWVKNPLTNLYEELNEAYMSSSLGATKQYVKDYALPREFNDVLYLTADGYSKEIPDTPASGIQYTATSEVIGYTNLFECDYTVGDTEFQLASKNSYNASFYIKSENTETVRLHLFTYYLAGENEAEQLLSVELSDEIQLTSTPQRIDFGGIGFTELGDEVLNVSQGAIIRQELNVFRTESAENTFDVLCSSVMPSRFYLFTNVVAITGAKVVQETGDSTTDVMSQAATTTALATKQNIMQFTVMPSPTADLLARVVQFVGASGTYINGRFYRCVYGTAQEPYRWVEISVMDLSNYVPDTRTVNGHALSSDVTVTASDVGLGNVANVGSSATPVENGATNFTTGGAYTELNKKLNTSDINQAFFNSLF